MAHIFGKKWRKGAFAFGGIGRIGLIRPIGHQPVDSPTCKPKGRFFRSVRLYLTDIMIDICRKWRKFWRKRAFAFGGIGQIGLIRPIGHQLVDSPTCKLVDSLTC